MTLGETIKFLRKHRNLTQIELSVILGVKKSTIQKYEAGAVTPKLETIRALCDYFGVQPWTFIYCDLITPSEILLQLELNSKAVSHLEIIVKLNNGAREKLFAYANDLLNAQNFTEKQ